LAKAFWPGALTMIVEASNSLPLKVTGNSGRIALRWPKQPVACKLIEIANTPLTGTSANLSGFAPCTSAHQVAEQLGDRLPLILDAGETERLVPSTIIDVRDEDYRVVREGAISEEEIVRTMA
ncbi:MAG TPA: L-threonylcarbamoyladenylate synthase, partial [Candidatus Dormibacteraeota bacterium]|nr:L-threonylcarbamoyladenylate synthase [Candidatus Dormibacteraeota bacterium]